MTEENAKISTRIKYTTNKHTVQPNLLGFMDPPSRIDLLEDLELFGDQERLSDNKVERNTSMKLLFSLFLLAAFGLLVNIIPILIKQPLFTPSEIREVQHRLNNIKYQ